MSANDKPDRLEAFERLTSEVHRTHQLLRALGAEVHPEDEITPSHRGVLEALADAPRTVPVVARARQVARQHIQVLVNELATLGLVVAKENPAHKRSPLVSLTAAGRRKLTAMRKREQTALDGLKLTVATNELARAAEHLGALADALQARLG